MRRRLGPLVAALTVVCAGALAEAPGSAVAVADLPKIADPDWPEALRVFQASCAARANDVPPLRAAVPAPAGLAMACATAARLHPTADPAAIRTFFTTSFAARRIAGDAFFTGYYEPVVAASPTATPAFATPLYAPPADLVGVAAGTVPGLDPALTAARRLPDGRLVAMPDRAAIEAGALGADARPLAYVASPVEAFFIQVQGSARLRLPDGRLRRLVYAGRNGYPYTAIGKVLVARLHVPPSAMGMDALKAWITANGQRPRDAGTELMRRNRSFIFFRFDDSLPAAAGPVGGEGISLTPGRSLAIDRTQYPYGLPFYVDTRLPDGSAFRRLMIGQDTGSAIVGPARADVFFGTGAKAAAKAGAMRQPGTLTVLWPRDAAAPKPTNGVR